MVRDLEKTISRKDVLVKDFSQIFTEKNKPPNVDIFGDHVHYTDAGRKIIVSEMIKLLKKLRYY